MEHYKVCQNCSSFIQDSKDLRTDLGICIMDRAFDPFQDEIMENADFSKCYEIYLDKRFDGGREPCDQFEELEFIEIPDNTESIMKCVNDFNRFIEFIQNEKSTLSAKSEVFGKKDSYRINSLLENQKPVSAPNYNQDQYPIIDLMFDLALLGKLYYRGNSAEGKPSLVKTPALDSYIELNNYEKYIFLLQTYWTKYKFMEKFDRWISVSPFFNFLAEIANSQPGQAIVKNEKYRTDDIYFRAAAFQHHLRFFGIGEPELIIREKKMYEDTISAFYPTSFGIEAARFLCTEALECWNRRDVINILIKRKYKKDTDLENVLNLEEERVEKLNSEPFEVFKTFFPEDQVVNTVKEFDAEDADGVYCFKVSLSKSLWRKIRMSGEYTLGDLHDAIQEAFAFDNDHLYVFYIGGNRKTGRPVYCEEAREGGITAEKMAIREIGLFVGQKLIYFFDFGDCWEFTVELMGIEKEATLSLAPVIVEGKGESPQQYGSEW